MNDDISGTGPDWDDEDALLEQLGKGLGMDPERTPPADRVAALRDAARRMSAERNDAGQDDHHDDDTVVPIGSGTTRRLLFTGGIAAGVAGVAGYVARDLVDEPPAPEAGPTIEPVTFTGEPKVASAGLINHTWGTELLLDVQGLKAGTAYDIVFSTTQGDVAAGSLLAVEEVLMKCRFNAAPLRADVRAITVRDPQGRPVLTAELPTVAT